MEGKIIFTRHYDEGTVTADQFPDEVLISRKLLDASKDGDVIKLDAEVMTIAVSNGRARYRVIDINPTLPAVRARKIEGQIID